MNLPMTSRCTRAAALQITATVAERLLAILSLNLIALALTGPA